MDYITLEKIVKEREKPSRFEHSLGVVEVSEVLARRFRLDVELSRMIGIFHDYNRYMDGDDMLSFCRKRGIGGESDAASWCCRRMVFSPYNQQLV